MKSITNLVAAAALATVSVTASAWWGGPWGNNGYWNPYYGGYAPYGYYGAYAPVAPLTEEQQKAMADQQAKAMQDAVEAQRKFAEQFTANQPEAFQAPFARPSFGAPADITARRNEIQKQMEIRRAEMVKRVGEQRAFAPTDRSFGAPADVTARRDEMKKQMEARRAEMMKRAEEQRTAAPVRRSFDHPADMTARRDEMKKQMDEQRKASEEQHAAMRKAMEERRQN